MTAPLPTREIALVLSDVHLPLCDCGGSNRACTRFRAELLEKICARLRPACEELDTLRVWQRDAQQTIFGAGKIAGELAKDRATLRASLARKDEALRGCGEALEKLSRRHKDLCSGGEECRLHDEADAALARAQA